MIVLTGAGRASDLGWRAPFSFSPTPPVIFWVPGLPLRAPVRGHCERDAADLFKLTRATQFFCDRNHVNWFASCIEFAHALIECAMMRTIERTLLNQVRYPRKRCAVYCRFCTRSRMVGGGSGTRSLEHLGPAFDYLAAHPEIRDVIVSGGDPLTLATERLVQVVAGLRAIESIETIRLATRVPVVLPQRITGELLRALAPLHPLWVMTHFNHPKELTPIACRGLERLANAGFPVMNQTVLLRGVNAVSYTHLTLPTSDLV